MPSPFPGMDPYLEDHWRDVHTRLVVYICDALQDTVPSDLRKQRELCSSDTSLVEIDLLRGGKHVLAIPLKMIPRDKRTSYMACVRRAWVKGMAEFYPFPLTQPLPRIKVPLRQSDADVVLDLQPLIEQCYRRGGYDGTIDYKKDPDLAFNETEAAWADALLRQAGLRTGPGGKGKRRRPPKAPGEA